MSGEDDKQQGNPPSAADEVAAQIERTHAAAMAAILASHQQAEDTVKQAQDIVAQAVAGAAEAMRLAQEATKKQGT